MNSKQVIKEHLEQAIASALDQLVNAGVNIESLTLDCSATIFGVEVRVSVSETTYTETTFNPTEQILTIRHRKSDGMETVYTKDYSLHN